MNRQWLGLLLWCMCLPAAAAQAPAPRWLMLVATLCTNPAREAEFNAWYDDIDIPDVLEVPGYQRARRGVVADDVVPATAPLPQVGRYVALYDIESPAIDKTIINMLMMARRMDARGRSIDALKVTERVYYRELSARRPGTAPAKSGEDYLYVERVECCETPAAQRRFNTWYDREHIAKMLKRTGVRSATRYELYQLLMIDPPPASKYLTVYELTADDAAAAQAEADAARQDLQSGAPQDDWTQRRSILFRKLKDVSRH
jgi:hypothetical protein